MADEEIQTDLYTTAEIKLYYDLLEPPELLSPAPLLIAVHGYGAHKRYMMREARRVAPPGMMIASIQAPHPHYRRTDDGYRIGFGWLSDHRPEEHVQLHHRFVLDVIETLAGDRKIEADNVFLYGFSQACALNFRFAFTHPDVLKGSSAFAAEYLEILIRIRYIQHFPARHFTCSVTTMSFTPRSNLRVLMEDSPAISRVIDRNTTTRNTRSRMKCALISQNG